jgi:hypothetical protein
MGATYIFLEKNTSDIFNCKRMVFTCTTTNEKKSVGKRLIFIKSVTNLVQINI